MHRRWPGVSDPRIKGMHSSRSNSRSHPTENTLETGAGFRTRQTLMPHPDCKYSRFSPGLCANASIYRSSLPDRAAPGPHKETDGHTVHHHETYSRRIGRCAQPQETVTTPNTEPPKTKTAQPFSGTAPFSAI
ncbi:hypothetical protein C0J56_10445 [Pseudomonas fluorescens]|nr:hypothetical protein C0J56_10445 [Pseudomonas fluorescens]